MFRADPTTLCNSRLLSSLFCRTYDALLITIHALSLPTTVLPLYSHGRVSCTVYSDVTMSSDLSFPVSNDYSAGICIRTPGTI